jgi:hypothetical protein
MTFDQVDSQKENAQRGPMGAKVAVAGAGIYGSTIAIRLAEQGHSVDLFDPLGFLRAASSINQFRVHAGYHYPRSYETITEIQQSRAEFQRTYSAAIVRDTKHYYAIPHEGSRLIPDQFEAVMEKFNLPLLRCMPQWMNFDFIDRCYEVDEQFYDADLLRTVIVQRIHESNVRFIQQEFLPAQREDYDFVVWATYGLGYSRDNFKPASYQIAEKILINLPAHLRGVSVLVIDGPFTAFDPYGSSSHSLFGSAKHTNHWVTTDPDEPLPALYANVLNRPTFEPVEFTKFEAMRADSALAIPESKRATYIGSRFTVRVTENNPEEDRRTLYVLEPRPGEIHVFSGKVVCAVRAADCVCERVARGAEEVVEGD